MADRGHPLVLQDSLTVDGVGARVTRSDSMRETPELWAGPDAIDRGDAISLCRRCARTIDLVLDAIVRFAGARAPTIP